MSEWRTQILDNIDLFREDSKEGSICFHHECVSDTQQFRLACYIHGIFLEALQMVICYQEKRGAHQAALTQGRGVVPQEADDAIV